MDLYAYTQIADLSAVAEANGISVPRLRGYRLMATESPFTAEEMRRFETEAALEVYQRACCSIPPFCPDSNLSEYSERTRAVMRKYITQGGEFRWDLLHGKRRRDLKFAVKKMRRMVRAENEAWNRYAGREDVLYIHARVGGGNWDYYGCASLCSQPWFLERVDDSFDGTYCTIYAKIKPMEVSSQ